MVMSDIPDDVWKKGRAIDGYSYDEWRHDEFGKVMKYKEYGNRDSQYGWEVDHIKPKANGGSDDLSNLRPLNYKSNLARNKT